MAVPPKSFVVALHIKPEQGLLPIQLLCAVKKCTHHEIIQNNLKREVIDDKKNMQNIF